MNDGREIVTGIVMKGGLISELARGGLESPTITVSASEEVVLRIFNSGSMPAELSKALKRGEIEIKAQKLSGRVKVGIAKMAMRIIGWFQKK